MREVPLSGGFVTTVTRAGDTVRRGRASPFVHDLLQHFEQSGWSGAPRHLGVDGRGRDIMEFVDGFVPWQEPTAPQVRTTVAVSAAARLLRACHDLTVGTPLAGDQQVVCHNDLSPRNTVYRDLGDGLVPVAFIDWDIAAPGERVHDIAHLCWQFVGLGAPAVNGWKPLLRAICDAYGDFERDRLVGTVLWWQDRCWRGIETAAASGDAAMARLCDLGVPGQIREAYDWVRRHQVDLEAAVH
jgi:hypothetical protein